jgi:Zn finger protein HypA/HybF involved in hydrogenase expression
VSRLDTVAGIERFAILREPNVIECDGCGGQITPNPRRYVGGDIRTTARLDHGWTHAGDADYCPRCQETGFLTTE